MVISSETGLNDFQNTEQEDTEQAAQQAEALARLLAYAATEAAALDLTDCHYFLTLAASRLVETAHAAQTSAHWGPAGLRRPANNDASTLTLGARS